MILESEQPRPIRVSALINEPYHKVSAVFADYKGEEVGLLGHFPRLGARPSYVPEPESHHSLNADYHVRTSFNEEQYRYIRVVRTRLAAFAQGTQKGVDGFKHAPSFSERVVGNFMSQGSNQSFVEAIVQSNLDLISGFADTHPNMMPAMDAFYVIGTAGTTLLLSPTHNLLEQAMNSDDGKLNAPPLNSFFSFAAPYSSGEGLNMFSEGLELESEVQCAGENIAITLWKEISKAAQVLAQLPEVKKSYRTVVDSVVPEGIDERIRSHVVDLSEAIKQTHTLGTQERMV